MKMSRIMLFLTYYGVSRNSVVGRKPEVDAIVVVCYAVSRTRIDPGTRLLIEFMTLPERGSVLDVGCGYGPVGIAAATFNPNLKVVMTDVNERAVWLAKENAKRNALQNVEVKQGFLYEPVGDMRFEIILSNPQSPLA